MVGSFDTRIGELAIASDGYDMLSQPQDTAE